MIDTQEIGAGTYPDINTNEKELKCFTFDFTAIVNGYGIVYAKNKKEALELISNNKYDEIVDTYDMAITEINGLNEVNDTYE